MPAQSRSASLTASLSVLRARGDRHHLGAQELHARDVGRLPADVLLAHVDHAGKAEEGARRGAGDAVLAGTGLGDDALLAEPLGDQRLPERVVDLVGPGVRQILPLEPDVVAEFVGQALGRRDRRGPAHEVARQASRVRAGSPRRPSAGPSLGQLVQGGDQDLGHVPAAVVAEPSARVGHRRGRACCRLGWLIASMSSTPRSSSARAPARAGSPATHQRLAHQDGRRARSTAASTSAARGDPAFHHRDAIGSDAAEPARALGDVDLEGLEIAGVDADRSGRRSRAPVRDPRPVGLEQDAEAQVGGHRQQGGDLGVRADTTVISSTASAPWARASISCAGMHQEVLPQHRDAGPWPARRPGRAASHGSGVARSGPRPPRPRPSSVGLRLCDGVSVLRDLAGRRRGPLDLRDDRRPSCAARNAASNSRAGGRDRRAGHQRPLVERLADESLGGGRRSGR